MTDRSSNGRFYVAEANVEAVLRALRFPNCERFTEPELVMMTGLFQKIVNNARRELVRRGLIELAGVRRSSGTPREWRVKQ
jgi:hypothetical protein